MNTALSTSIKAGLLSKLSLKKCEYKHSSTFRYVKFGSAIEIYIKGVFDSKHANLTKLYLNEEDEHIDHASIQNDADVVLNDLSISLSSDK